MTWVFASDAPPAGSPEERVLLLGGKGAGLAEMTNAGLPVPPGFTISTDACRLYYKGGAKVPPFSRWPIERAA